MKAFVTLKNGTQGYLWNGRADLHSFAIVETNDGSLAFGIITAVDYH